MVVIIRNSLFTHNSTDARPCVSTFFTFKTQNLQKTYDITIGLEVHAQLSTQSKVFAPDATTFGAQPNTQVSYITLAHPGTLPFLNQKVVQFAIMLGIATNCTIREYNEFSRKNYYYADLPKGYQVSQYDTPICYNGHIEITLPDGSAKRIRINRIHIEEDAGKSIHDQHPRHSFIDLNRAGVPLLEIVTEPEINSADEAYLYVAKLRQIMQYLGVCDGNMEEGSLRCDVNLSVKPASQTQLGERVEVKNLNSLRNIKRAIEFESARQLKLVTQGIPVNRETRSFDATNGTTFPLRSKELEHDYRYFPEPDLPPLLISPDVIDKVRTAMPALPQQLAAQLITQYELSPYDAAVLTDTKETVNYFLQTVQHTPHYKAVANWVMGPVKSWLNANNTQLSEFVLKPQNLAALVNLTQTGKVSFSVAAQDLLPACINQPDTDPHTLAEQLGLTVQHNDDLIAQLIQQVIDQNPDKVIAYQKGKKGLLGFFMGQITRLSVQKLHPPTVQRLLEQRLNNQ